MRPVRAPSWLVAAALLVLSAWLGAAGCGGRASVPSESGGREYFGSVRLPGERIFRFNNAAEPEQLDPGLMSGQPDGRIARAIFEGLVVSDPHTLAPLPGQAYRWDISPDRKIYVFHLRPGIRWSNGRAVTAGDFEWSWKRVLDPAVGSRYAGILSAIEYADSFNQKRLSDPSLVGVHALDDSTLQVKLVAPTPYFLSLLTFYTCLPVPREVVEKYGDRWTRPEHLVTNGPFLLKSWKLRESIELVKNPGYWDAAHVKLDRIIAYPVDDQTTSTNMYKAGVIDWQPSGNVPAPFLPFMRKYADFKVGRQQAVYFYSVNVTRKPFDNVWVRRALNLALDRQTLCDKVLKGTRPPWGLFCPSGYVGYEPPAPITFHAEEARRDLARAGYPDGKGFPKVEILINTSEDHRRIAEAVQAMWRATLNIPIGVANQEWASYLENTTKVNYDIARRSWIGDYPDPSTFLNIMRSGDGNNRTGWSNAAYDRLIAEAGAEPDTSRRMKLLSEAEALLLSESPVIPVYHYVTMELVKPYVRGLYPTVLDYHPLKFVSIDPDWRNHPEPADTALAADARP
jgi:ABC-type oligopeptide transport system substrate-binding subunit